MPHTSIFYIIFHCCIWLLLHPFQTCFATLFCLLASQSDTQLEDGALLLMGLLLSCLCEFFLNFLHLYKAKQWIYGFTGLLTGAVCGHIAQNQSIQILIGLSLAIACVWQAQRPTSLQS
jgi:hypothetical protein